MRRLATAILVGAALASGAGCILPDQMKQVERDVASMRRELAAARQEQERSAARLDSIEAKVDEVVEGGGTITRDDFADLTVQLQQITRDLDGVDQRVTDLSRRIEDVAEDASQAREYARTSPGPTGAPAGGGDEMPVDAEGVAGGEVLGAQPDPEALYNTAYADYAKGNYALAISGFEEYQQRFPDKPNADNALYWVAECRLSQGDFGGAIEGFDDLLGRYPDSDKAATANLKKALAYLEQNDIQRAILQFRYVHSEYAGTDEAKIARDKLASLGAPV